MRMLHRCRITYTVSQKTGHWIFYIITLANVNNVQIFFTVRFLRKHAMGKQSYLT